MAIYVSPSRIRQDEHSILPWRHTGSRPLARRLPVFGKGLNGVTAPGAKSTGVHWGVMWNTTHHHHPPGFAGKDWGVQYCSPFPSGSFKRGSDSVARIPQAYSACPACPGALFSLPGQGHSFFPCLGPCILFPVVTVLGTGDSISSDVFLTFPPWGCGGFRYGLSHADVGLGPCTVSKRYAWPSPSIGFANFTIWHCLKGPLHNLNLSCCCFGVVF